MTASQTLPDIPNLSNELLQFLSEIYKIDKSNVLEDMKHMKNQKIIDKHLKSYSIWQNASGRYLTYLPDKTKPKGRRQISRSTREHLDNEILQYYKSISSKAANFQTLYFEWLELKRLEVSGATIERIHTAYERFYKNHAINEIQVSQINYLYLKKFLLATVKEYDMNYKQYCNFSCILRGVLEHACEKELIPASPYSRFKIGRHVLRQSDTKKSETEVFTIHEREQLETLIWQDYKDNQTSTVPLAILLDFYTGLRSGELVTLSKTDIQGEYLHIHRTESSYTEILEDGSKGDVIYEVKEAPKSSSGFRDVYLIDKARAVLDEILAFNKAQGWNNNFLFLDENKRIIRKRLDTQIRKYCKKLGITTRSMHKIRKYYISALKLNGVPDEEIKRSAGHRELTTTYNSYCFTITERKETETLIKSAL